ncbi:MAG TPA: hypothetical protein DDW51_05500 [Cyanobacteria bacterium UBA11367]|nr:hypothetical protein [Cyanobacteria bacterium UBA11367]HBE56787.1 hypothetical protein [Cyanobacteria bacterium UBA11366]HCA94653.1 hypothetical protein [Cyanobacteria bacterium UBA9226]
MLIVNDLSEFIPRFLPPGWKKLQISNLSPVAFSGPKALKVLMSVSVEEDNELWIHVSLSHRNRLPTYEEMKVVKSIFIGNEQDAIQIFPRLSNHVNIHPYCLHLWSCLNPNKFPDFTRGLGMI